MKQGIIVEVDATDMIECPTCGGYGFIEVDTPWSGSEPTKECPECEGLGLIKDETIE